MKRSGSIESTITQGCISVEYSSSRIAVGDYYNDEVDIIWKGTLSKYKTTLKTVKFNHLSSIKLIGEF